MAPNSIRHRVARVVIIAASSRRHRRRHRRRRRRRLRHRRTWGLLLGKVDSVEQRSLLSRGLLLRGGGHII